MKTKKLQDGSVFVYDEEVEAKLGGVIDELLNEVKDVKNWGVISPLILSKDNSILWHGGYVAPNLVLPMSYGAEEKYIGQYPGTRAVDVVRFYCAIISKELVKKFGVPEELGDNVFDDANYCLQAMANDFVVLTTDVVNVTYLGKSQKRSGVAKYAQELAQNAQAFQNRWRSTLAQSFNLPVCYQARINAPTGFAVAVGNYIKALSQSGVDVRYNYLMGAPETESMPEDLYLTAVCENDPDTEMPQVVWAQAPLFFKNSGKYKIGHCEFEGEEWPKVWVTYCNMMNEIWVPTKWDREKAIKAGVNKPIYIVQQGIDPEYFHPKIAPMQMEAPQTFKFVCNAAWLPRKNLGNLMKVFAKTFKKSEDVCLVIKTMNLGLVESVEKEIKELNIPDNSGWIYCKEEDLLNSHVPSFYTMGHCFVLPTHGEGWGLPVFEAAACGLPVITTGYGAPNEVLRDKADNDKPYPGIHLLNYRLVKARTNYEYLKNAKWAEPDLLQLAEKMRYVYDNYAKEKERAMQTSKIIRDKFSWVNVVKPIIARLEEIYKKGF